MLKNMITFWEFKSCHTGVVRCRGYDILSHPGDKSALPLTGSVIIRWGVIIMGYDMIGSPV